MKRLIWILASLWTTSALATPSHEETYEYKFTMERLELLQKEYVYLETQLRDVNYRLYWMEKLLEFLGAPVEEWKIKLYPEMDHSKSQR